MMSTVEGQQHRTGKVSLVNFPPELVMEIFHYGCILSTQFCTSLCQIAKWTRSIALPYLYSTVVIKKHGNNRAFSLVLNRKDPLFQPPSPSFSPKICVENLWVEAVSNTVLSIFESCPNIRNIALPPVNLLWILHASSYQRRPFLPLSPHSLKDKASLHLLITNATSNRSLVRYPQTTPPLDLHLLTKVTHLRIGQMKSYDSLPDLTQYSNLTHVAIPYHQPEIQPLSELPGVMNHQSIMVLVVVLLTDQLSAEQYEDALSWFKNIRSTSSKIFAVTSRLCDLQAEWEEEARRGLSIWRKAEQFSDSIDSQPLVWFYVSLPPSQIISVATLTANKDDSIMDGYESAVEGIINMTIFSINAIGRWFRRLNFLVKSRISFN